MKRLSIFNKILYVLNWVAIILLLVACAVPHITSEKFSFLAFLSLGVPFLVVTNFLFVLFWLLKRKKQFLPSLFVLIFGYFSLGAFLKFNFSEKEALEEDLSIMSYNVRTFNKYGGSDNPRVFEDVKALVDKEDPDIICFQEVDYDRQKEYEKYPHRFLHYIHNRDKTLMGIFSKYPIIKSELIDFPQSHNSAAYADILYKKDTIRIYNVHLQSLGITPGKGVISRKRTDKLFKMLSKSFAKQQQQATILAKHMATSKYHQILCGDFNNTQFSNIYKTIKGDKNDSFIEKGKGYGRTLTFHKLPVRIDFILSDPVFEVQSHTNYDVKYSDHYPLIASFKLNSN